MNNGWVIGTATGILSGLLVWWVTYQFLTKKEDREYRQKVIGANRDVIYAIRPGISEGQIPDREIVIALTNATARRYALPPSALYRPFEIVEELIKEIMDSSFISSSQKAQYCAQLAPLAREPQLTDSALADAKLRDERRRKTQRILMAWSAIVGIAAAIITGIWALSRSAQWSDLGKSTNNDQDSVFGLILGIVAFVAIMVLPGIAKSYRLKNEKKEQNQASAEQIEHTNSGR